MKKCLAIGFTLLAVVMAASPAWAHEEISPRTFSTGEPTFFVLSAANEEPVELTRITITAPGGVPIGATTKEPAGWTAATSATAITWTAGAGAGIKPEHFDQWGFETDGADQPGTFTFKATLAFAGGKTTDAQIPVTVVASGQPAPAASTTVASGVTTTSVTAAAPLAAGPASANQARSRANIALAIGSVALVLGLAAMAAGLRRRRPQQAGGTPGKTEDW